MNLRDRIIAGERAAIAKAITLVESSREEDIIQSHELISELIKSPGHAIRVGFSGPPGVGKSTFIESFGSYIVSKNFKLGVLAIDPSSNFTGGSILGDKTRMSEISKNENTFIRSTPSRGSLGGIAVGTREAAIILDAAGYDYIFIETVGVGQSEITAANLVDIFTLIVGPGSGDELQGIKKGITEYADIFIVNKNDGDLASQASKTASDYKSALSFYNKDSDALETQVVLVSSIENKGMDEVLDSYNKIVNVNKVNNQFDKRRENQLAYWLEEEVRNKILLKLSSEKETSELLESEVRRIISGETGFYLASQVIIDRFLSKK
ncbi:methylmalonyl Co-A mutase-associated GTPase MeaB [Pelagibacteraceae bacterium]|nr:methylmalonyl Co-A mutase-associated GTPase MeaB [Pelagibacteraceae bacterium]MDA9677659.1 methylmalonyl Co-A mutase-associated GTPase MeaB [Pelagibacteraceae bacterium]